MCREEKKINVYTKKCQFSIPGQAKTVYESKSSMRARHDSFIGAKGAPWQKVQRTVKSLLKRGIEKHGDGEDLCSSCLCLRHTHSTALRAECTQVPVTTQSLKESEEEGKQCAWESWSLLTCISLALIVSLL